MKKEILLIAATLLIYAVATGQIPNNSFENWTSMGAYSNPTGWGTMNNKTASLSVYTATKATPGTQGTAYLKLTSKKAGSTVVNGIAVSGKLDSMSMQPLSGFAFNQKPTALTGKWQYMGSSPGSIKVTLTKWNASTNMREIVGTATKTLSGMVMSWAGFSIPFTYQSSALPDSCIILLQASGANPVANDYLWIDELAFTGITTQLNNEINVYNNLTVSPNPSNGFVTLNFNTNSSQQKNIQLIDMAGKVVFIKNVNVIKGESEQTIDISQLAKGSYFIKVISTNENEIKKLIIK